MSEPQPYRPRCIHLTCKSMQVWGEDFQNDPEFQAGMVEFWCTETFKNLGPDGNDVTYEACLNPERKCFREWAEVEVRPPSPPPQPGARS